MEIEGSGEAAAHDRAWAGPLSTRIRRLPSAREAWTWLARQVAWQGERWTLWTPVAPGCGVALHFALPREPQAWLARLRAAVTVRSAGQAIFFRPNVKQFGAALWARRRGLDPSGGEAARDLRGRRPWTWRPDLR